MGPPATSHGEDRAGIADQASQRRFTALFDRTYPALLGYAVRRVADPSDAADVVAETFLIAWRRLDDVPADDGARAWLFATARRVLANHHRGQRRQLALAQRLRNLPEEMVPPPEPADSLRPGRPAGPSAHNPADSTVLQALARLSPQDSELLRLVAWEGLARDEIAVVLAIPRATQPSRWCRPRQI